MYGVKPYSQAYPRQLPSGIDYPGNLRIGVRHVFWSARTCPRFGTGRHVSQWESGDLSPHSKSRHCRLLAKFQYLDIAIGSRVVVFGEEDGAGDLGAEIGILLEFAFGD